MKNYQFKIAICSHANEFFQNECQCICIPNNVRWQLIPKLNRHQRELFHLQNVAYSLDAQSTNRLRLDCALADQRQRKAYRLRKMLINMPNTANEKPILISNQLNEPTEMKTVAVFLLCITDITMSLL